MLPLPPVPLHLGWKNRVRLGRDYYVRIDTSDYSAGPHAIGQPRRRDRGPGPGPGPRGRPHHRRPSPRLGSRDSDDTDPAHKDAAAALRREFQRPRAAGAGEDVARDLADYDRAFGLTSGELN